MKDRLSALLDGELDEEATNAALDRLQQDPALRQDWSAYCLIGDVLRGEPATAPDFVDRVMAGLDKEPTVLAPMARTPERAAAPRLWRSLMPFAASVMGVAAVGFVAATLYSADPAVVRVAANERAGTIAGASRAPAPSDQELQREYVFAHQGVHRGGPMPASVQYVRSVTDLQQGDGR